MTVRVLLFASARDRLGRGELAIELPEGARIAELLESPALAALAPMLGSLRYAVNEEFAALGSRVRDGDVVALLPPVSGG